MIRLLTFFGSLWGRVALGAGIVAALVAVRAADISKQRRIGETRAVARIEKATDNAVKIGRASARKSGAPATGRMHVTLDPTTRND